MQLSTISVQFQSNPAIAKVMKFVIQSRIGVNLKNNQKAIKGIQIDITDDKDANTK